MFDIGFIELLVCGVIALLVLGPERLPVAARATGRWIGKARRMTRHFTNELDRQLKADELREKIRKEGSKLGAEDIQRNYQQGLDQARKYTDYLVKDELVKDESASTAPASGSATGSDSSSKPASMPSATPEPLPGTKGPDTKSPDVKSPENKSPDLKSSDTTKAAHPAAHPPDEKAQETER